jgi:superoxide dismutase, Fe-Mn family
MNDNLENKIKKEIIETFKKHTSHLNENTISEALVAQIKKFNINTDYLSDGNIQNHIELYEKYTENFSEVSAKLDTAVRSDIHSNHSAFRNLKIDETFNMNGSYFHELYFANIGDNNSQINMDTLSYMRLARDFGTFDDWQRDFIACAQGSRCGWAITYLNLYTQTYMNCIVDFHSQNVPAGMYPVIAMDMWQHSYYKDYLKDSKSYLIAMMKQLRWSVIEERFKKADKILAAIK